jgi:predicted SnoaL-like aldol condensation-catalyzing enzyme
MLKETALTDNKQIVRSAMTAMYDDHDPTSAEGFFGPSLVQHGSLAADGVDGLSAFVAGLGTDASHDLHRVFAEDDLVVTHATYTGVVDAPSIGFELWRLRDGLIVEHWDGFEPLVRETASGRGQIDGPTDSTGDGSDTAANKAIVDELVQTILVDNDFSNLAQYLAGEDYAQHNHRFADGISGLAAALQALAEQGITMTYSAVHHTVAEHDFVFTLSEGAFGGAPFAFYDLFRVAAGRAVEHWDVMTPEPAPLPHDNGLY